MPVSTRTGDARMGVVAAVDNAFAEAVRVVFMSEGRIDPQRLETEIEAVLLVGAGRSSNVTGSEGRSWGAKIAGGKAELHIDASRYTGLTFAIDDAVQALSRRGQPWFGVARVDDRGNSRIVLELYEK